MAIVVHRTADFSMAVATSYDDIHKMFEYLRPRNASVRGCHLCGFSLEASVEDGQTIYLLSSSTAVERCYPGNIVLVREGGILEILEADYFHRTYQDLNSWMDDSERWINPEFVTPAAVVVDREICETCGQTLAKGEKCSQKDCMDVKELTTCVKCGKQSSDIPVRLDVGAPVCPKCYTLYLAT